MVLSKMTAMTTAETAPQCSQCEGASVAGSSCRTGAETVLGKPAVCSYCAFEVIHLKQSLVTAAQFW